MVGAFGFIAFWVLYRNRMEERFASDISDVIYCSGGNSGLGIREVTMDETLDLILVLSA